MKETRTYPFSRYGLRSQPKKVRTEIVNVPRKAGKWAAQEAALEEIGQVRSRLRCRSAEGHTRSKLAGHLRWGCRCGKRPRGGGGAGGAGVEWGVQAALAASRCALAAAALAFAAACCCLCRCLGLLYAKLLRLLQLRCSPTATSFFHSKKVVLKNTGLLSSAAHAQCSLSNQNDCSRCAGALFASAGSSE